MDLRITEDVDLHIESRDSLPIQLVGTIFPEIIIPLPLTFVYFLVSQHFTDGSCMISMSRYSFKAVI